MSTETTEDVDLSDLDMLDGLAHARCTFHQPDPGPAGVFEALCGRKALMLNPNPPSQEVPPNACGECEELWAQPCRVCGM